MTTRTYSGYTLAPRSARLGVFIEAIGEHLGLSPKVEVESSFFKSLIDWSVTGPMEKVDQFERKVKDLLKELP